MPITYRPLDPSSAYYKKKLSSPLRHSQSMNIKRFSKINLPNKARQKDKYTKNVYILVKNYKKSSSRGQRFLCKSIRQ